MKILRAVLLIPAFLALSCAGASAAGRPGPGKLSPLADSMREVRRRPEPAALRAFSRFSSANGGAWEMRFNPRTALPESLAGGRTHTRYPGRPEQAAAAFLDANRDLLGVDTSGLKLELQREYLGLTHLQYRQYYKDIPIEFGYVRAHVTADGRIAGYQAKYEPAPDLDVVPGITAAQAEVAAAADLGAQLLKARSELVIYPDEQAGVLKLAWKLRGRGGGGIWVYYVDARTGAVLLRYDDTRRYCSNTYNTMGTSSGTVYEISPIPTGTSDALAQAYWTKPVQKPITDQYFWVAGYANAPAVTDSKGDYCTNTQGKVYSTFKGPYFSVSSARGASAHYDNGGGVWRSDYSTITETPNPYANSTVYSSTVTIVPVPALTGGESLAKVMPRFDTFRVGEMDEYGNVDDDDEVHIRNPNTNITGNNTVGSYLGKRTRVFLGAAVENNSFVVDLKSNAAGTDTGYKITVSSYLVLTNSPFASAAPSAVVWSTSNASVYLDTSLGAHTGLDEVNAFYHLNKMRNFFETLNNQPSGALPKPVDLTRRVPVMVHASGLPDATPYRGMINAFYDLDNDNIFFGDGPDDYGYRSLALDGTIVRHEYTHLVVHRIYPIINFGEFGAISEALSDYFSMSSFWREGWAEGNAAKKAQAELGNFLGDIYERPISGTDRVMPGSWQGELYNDSGVLTQSLYPLRRGGALDLGLVSGSAGGTFDGLPVSDFLVWSSIFYFPDSFLNFYTAMKDACTQLNYLAPGSCPAVAISSITASFAAHGIVSSGVGTQYAYETGSNSGMCMNNNGPECAAEVPYGADISAALYPAGDADFYSLPLAAGNLQVTMSLPAGSVAGNYKAYALTLFDSDREFVAEAVPVLNEWQGYCSAADCNTLYPTVTLNAAVSAGRYYLSVAGGPTLSYGNSGVNSPNPYTLKMTYTPGGNVTAYLNTSSTPDNDLIGFSGRYNSFAMSAAPSSGTLTGAEQVFAYAVLRDHNSVRLDDTRTNIAGSLMALEGGITLDIDTADRTVMTGNLRIKPGFTARYPGAGTVTVELFGRNHMGNIVSLGVSNKLNLSASASTLKAFNNLIGSAGGKATLRYEMASPGSLSIKVYTQSGTLVKTLYDGPASGKGSVDWDGTNSNGARAASGIYIIKASGPGLNKADKVAIVR